MQAKPLVLTLLLPALCAAGPFDGTWKMELTSVELNYGTETFDVAEGHLRCSTCTPVFDVPLDGTEQALVGPGGFDSLSVRSGRGNVVTLTRSKGGKPIWTGTYAVSRDGKELTVSFSDQAAPAGITGELVYRRLATGPTGKHPLTGAWEAYKLRQLSASGTTITFQERPNGLHKIWADGRSYEAAFDFKGQPILPDSMGTTVTLARLSPTSFQELERRDGKITQQRRFKLAEDGRSLQVMDHSLEQNRVARYKLTREGDGA